MKKSYLLIGIVLGFFTFPSTTALFTPSHDLTGTFLLLEIILWVLGYLLLAIPIQLISYAVIRYLGYGKGGNGVRKAIGDLSIWVFCGLYLLLLTNFILSLIHFNTLVPVG